MAKRIKIGDVVKFEFDEGVAYAIYTHDANDHGSVIRVFNKVYNEPQDDISLSLSDSCTSFVALFPLQLAVNIKKVSIVDHINLPEIWKPFPLFKAPKGLNLSTMQPNGWSIWDGEKFYDVNEFNGDFEKLPRRELGNYQYIINRIKSKHTN